MEHSGSGNSSVPGTSGRSLVLEIDLNETPLPSPREVVGGGGGGGRGEFDAAAVSTGGYRCGSCGELEGEMVVCGECRRRFHVECLGIREEQREWRCFECLIECGSERKTLRCADFAGVGLGLLDMNASPPREADGDEEGFFMNSDVALAASLPRMQDMRGYSFAGYTLSSPMMHPDMRHVLNGFPSQNASCSVARIAQLNLEIATQKASSVYLQTLKDYISARGGVIEDGWHVKFEYCESSCKTFAVYCAPDGSRFDSQSKVAQHLSLPYTCNPVQMEDKGRALPFLPKGSHANRRTKEASRSLRGNNLREHKSVSRSRVGNGGNAEVEPVINGTYGSQSFLDGFPVRFEDFFVISVGKIDQRLSFHNTCEIWPVGYKSVWHDKFTGSIFLCEVLDGGEIGPIFRVRRCPCSKQSIPNASTVLCRPKCGPVIGKDGAGNYDSAVNGMFHDDDNIEMMLTEHTPPHLVDDNSSSSWDRANCSVLPFQGAEIITSDNFGRGDVIGEFSVEGTSSSSAWEKVLETLLCACREAFNNISVLKFCCNHGVEESSNVYNFDSLGKFCYLAGPVNSMPNLILTSEELEATCKVLGQWLRLDRFGLNAEFVQELIEQLPGVSACSEYRSVNARCRSLPLQTVGSGFFTAIRLNNLQNETVLNSLTKSHKRPSPPGNTITSNLPPHLIGDALQVYEFCMRFPEVLGLEEPLSRQELEAELMNPWVDGSKLVTNSANEIQNYGGTKPSESDRAGNLILNSTVISYSKTCGGDSKDVTEDSEGDASRAEAASKCTGVILANCHMAMLKVLVGDMLTKVVEVFDPFGRPRKGRKKEVDIAVAVKKIKLGMLPVNEFTWPELARRYILSVLAMDGNLESSDVMNRECGNVFHCLHGDGGTLCGALTGVAAMEADAVILAEASKKIFSSLKSKIDDFIIDQKDLDAGDSSKETNITDNESPEWTQVLEPVRKLPTNVGARIRRCIHQALDKNPPEWAKEMLLYSISKEVYKGNASGPTKRTVVSVLERYKSENPQQQPTEKKEKEKSSVRTLSDVLVKRCRMVLRSVASADEDRVFFNLLGKILLKPNDSDDAGLLGYPAMVSRPLDFRTVDLRLAAGVYGASHESFIEDVREVWRNLRIAYRDRPDYVDLIATLSQKFEELYEQEVLNLVNRTVESGINPDLSTDKVKKELSAMLADTSESPLPTAPWEDGVCKVCGMDKDDDSVLLCDKCDSEYHTYCLDPPLARIPEGNWYCPSCVSSQSLSQDARCGTRALSCWPSKKKLQKQFTRSLLEALAILADTMELMEYWEFGIEERVYLIKYLCDEALSSAVVRNHLGADSADVEKKLRKYNKELKNQRKKEDPLAATLTKEVEEKNDACGEELWSFSKSSSDKQFIGSSSQSQVQNEENEENGSVGATKAGEDHENLSQEFGLEAAAVKNKVSSLQDKISALESEIVKLAVRREYLGRDSAGRLYWLFGSPERVVVSGPQVRGKEYVSSSSFLSHGIDNSSSPQGFEISQMYASDRSLWTCYKSDTDIEELVGWLRDDDAKEKELKESILQWQRNKPNDPSVPQNLVQNVVQDTTSRSSIHGTKARAALEKKFGSFTEQGPIQYPKKQVRKGKVVNEGKMYRCDCLELVGSARQHCSSCHWTFFTDKELEEHEGKCDKRKECEGPSNCKRAGNPRQRCSDEMRKGKKELDGENPGENKQPLFDNQQSKSDSPFNLEEIKTKFCTRRSVKEEVNDIGLIGSNGTPSFVNEVPPQDSSDASLLVPETRKGVDSYARSTELQQQEKQGSNEPSKVDRMKPKGMSGKDQSASSKTRSLVRICQSSLRPLVGRVSEILRCLKINLLDIEAALPEEALRPSRGGFDRIRAWRAFVKSAQSIYQMVQATIVLEDMIRTEYLRKEWWYWSSPSTAAKISTVSALALRIYALDAAICYENSPLSNVEPEADLLDESPEKSNSRKRESSEKLSSKRNRKSSSSSAAMATDIEPAETSTSKTRPKKRRRSSRG